MDYVEKILVVASEIYDLCKNVKANKERCSHICTRVKTLDNLVRNIQEKKTFYSSEDLSKILKELCTTIDTAHQLIANYATANWMERLLKSGSHEDKFENVNKYLSDGLQVLSSALQVKLWEMATTAKPDAMDKKGDDVLETLDKSQVIAEDVRVIRPEDLKFHLPKTPIRTTPTFEVFKGEYNGFTVAIQRYIQPMHMSPEEVHSIVNEKVHTLKQYESPYILRMFGVCIQDQDGPKPQFFFIVEFCGKGILRDVLDSDTVLSWATRTRMCLDASQGLYRLHHTEATSKIHGNISSTTFMVDDGYGVKLGGFELRPTQGTIEEDAETKRLCYISPEMLSDSNREHSTEDDIYSFGIVMWEIATRKKTFEGFSDREIYEKVVNEKFQEQLPEDCPASLVELINVCRAHDSFQRPSAEALVEKLCCVVSQLEEQ